MKFPDTHTKFNLDDQVCKTRGSKWSGKVVGWYSTALTPEGYAVESSTETGSVQIYPATALEKVEDDRDIIVEEIFEPYLEGKGPKFYLKMWDTHKEPNNRRYLAETNIGYELKMDDEVIFTGEDYRCSPMHCIDSEESVNSLMGFLTLKPGDTDSEYFDNYTEVQLAFCSEHAEALGGLFCDD